MKVSFKIILSMLLLNLLKMYHTLLTDITVIFKFTTKKHKKWNTFNSTKYPLPILIYLSSNRQWCTAGSFNRRCRPSWVLPIRGLHGPIIFFTRLGSLRNSTNLVRPDHNLWNLSPTKASNPNGARFFFYFSHKNKSTLVSLMFVMYFFLC